MLDGAEADSLDVRLVAYPFSPVEDIFLDFWMVVVDIRKPELVNFVIFDYEESLLFPTDMR